ncbi:MAG TPA: family 1 glycosylhydrolase [Archangium sp.]|jgi:dTDP-4-dehydrorhamnose reductase|uniref:family 1 glycosylhydrolase n=1 Tax=Archangium sp. TaxID=1872627 RepID=UPI002ED98B22
MSSHPNAKDSQGLELWGGLECTVNRVGDVFFDQMERNGHATRVSDLHLFAGLGIRAIRYPVLWERVAPDSFENIDWTWADERLGGLRELNIRPIVGLTHHGSGPRHTSLMHDSFATGLADFALRVAERYPWVDAYTPVNEPVTTARFSGLYGVWYPHGKDHPTFARALVTECRAVVLSMKAIRTVNPRAQLIQTEDLGRRYSTPALAQLAEFQNQRRWLSLDLLCGRLDREHPLHGHMLQWGIGEAELEWFLENPCPPDVVGINHYASSDRYLDERLDNYPARAHMDEEGVRYADMEAVRARLDIPIGVDRIIRETWERYRLPVAVTEAHLGSTRDEQVRWLKEFWDAASRMRHEGVDVRAVTVWSLLGSFDWNILVSRVEGFYEPGPFDVRAPRPRPTALAHLMRDLAAGRTRDDDPLLQMPGWWHRPDRIVHPPVEGRSYARAPVGPGLDMEDRGCRPLVILGATGTLGHAFARLCDVRGIPYHLLTRSELNLTDPHAVDSVLRRLKPWAVVNAAGYVRVDEAEREAEQCLLTNAVAPARLAGACARHGVQLVTFSSDLVFDGSHALLHKPYVESDPVAPLGVYGRSKAEMETRVREVMPQALIIRTSALFGPWDDANFITSTLRALDEGRRVVVADDELVSPTYVVDLVHTVLDLLIDREEGVWHLANQGATTWIALARRAAMLADMDSGSLEPRPAYSLGRTARRPRYSVLGSERGGLMPTLEDALRRYVRERRVQRMTHRQSEAWG